MTRGTAKRDGGTFFLYVFGFILLWEWIRPLETLTETTYINVFVFYILLSFIMAFLRAPIWISWSVKVLYILNYVYRLYFTDGFFSKQWIGEVIVDSVENITYVLEGQWLELTNVFRTILFFLLLSIMTYLIHYWLLNQKRIFLFFVITLIYITILDTFTSYSAKEAIIRAVITGFASMGILTLNRILIRENIGSNISFSKKWLTLLTGLIILSVGIGFIGPKAEPIWPDPVPFIQSLNDKSGGATQRVGYGVDDSQLGGPFVGDNQVVFGAETESKHYWRVETKEIYTGKGWIGPSNDQSRVIVPMVPFDSKVPIYAFESEVEVREQEATIFPFIAAPHSVYPFGVRRILTWGGIGTGILELDPNIEKIYFENERRNTQPYTITYDVPRYSVTKLQQVTSSEQARLDSLFVNRYTQVPTTLPREVKELALEITKGEKTWFDKARAIENYFDLAMFSYSQKDVAVPKRNEDYVAQFLFDTKVGYCDNFSSSMAVLLRTLGIPTRWVKGYTAGEYKELGSNSRKIYEVTNNNAHSWVEVYFPGSGWLAFEPTPGYTNHVSLNFDTYKKDTPKTETPISEKQPAPVNPKLKENESEQATSSFSLKNSWLKVKGFFKYQWKWVVFDGIVLGFILLVFYKKRSRWMPYYLIWRYTFRKKDNHFEMAYVALLRQLERYGLKREPHQTLRDYAKYVDSFFFTNDMTRLTNRYELLIYKGKIESGSWRELRELWENLIKKTTA
jgi:transglutaminase-like putative cysteine protease